MKKKVLIIVFSNLKNDPRVRRQTEYLSKDHDLTVACFDAYPTDAYKIVLLKPVRLTLFVKLLASLFLLTRLYPLAHRLLHGHPELTDKLTDTFDLIIANDVESLPLAFSFQGKPAVLFDAHEYAPRHFENKLSWRIFFQGFNTYLCKKYIPKVAAMTTVSYGLANEYKRVFGTKPVVISNAALYHDLQPQPTREDKIRLVHHGVATPNRHLERMIEMFEYLDERFELDMYLLGAASASSHTKKYPQRLRELASKHTSIKILPPIKSEEIVRTIHQYDMGVFLIPPVNFNYANTLPNKLFDFIQARLAIAIGPTPDMKRIVDQYKLGVISDDFSARNLAEKLNRLTKSDLDKFKRATTIAAQELNAEKNGIIFKEIISTLVGI